LVRAALAKPGSPTVVVYETSAKKGAALTPFKTFDFQRVCVDQAPAGLQTLANDHECLPYHRAAPFLTEASVDALLSQAAEKLAEAAEAPKGSPRASSTGASRVASRLRGFTSASALHGRGSSPSAAEQAIYATWQSSVNDLQLYLDETPALTWARAPEVPAGDSDSDSDGEGGVQEFVDSSGRSYFHDRLSGATAWSCAELRAPASAGLRGSASARRGLAEGEEEGDTERRRSAHRVKAAGLFRHPALMRLSARSASANSADVFANFTRATDAPQHEVTLENELNEL
jgi:hypothetical protein